MKSICTIVIFLTAFSITSPSAHAIEVGLELRPGASIPIGAFPDGVPAAISDADGSLIGYGANSIYNVLFDINTGAGFNFGLTLLLNNFTITASLALHKYTTVEPTRWAFVQVQGQQVPDYMHNIYVGTFVPQEIDVSSEASVIIMPRIVFGYRWYLLDWVLRPYVPIGIGAALFVMDDVIAYGPTAHIGLGLEYRVSNWIDIGIIAQYEWMGFILPDNFTADAAKQGLTTTATSGTSAFEAFLESFHTVQVAATTTFRF